MGERGERGEEVIGFLAIRVLKEGVPNEGGIDADVEVEGLLGTIEEGAGCVEMRGADC